MPRDEARAAIERARYLNGGKARMRARHLQRTYGITTQHYDWLKRKQHNTCAICHQPETKLHKSGEPYELAVDHDHTTGTIRGLLCSNCNQALGLLQDDTDRLRAAIRYLNRTPPKPPAAKPPKPQPPLIRIIPRRNQSAYAADQSPSVLTEATNQLAHHTPSVDTQ